MSEKLIKIDTHLPVIPEWLKINNSISFKLPLKSAKELAKKLAEASDDVDVEVNFDSGKKMAIEIKYESKTPA
jgi:hypothetical protein